MPFERLGEGGMNADRPLERLAGDPLTGHAADERRFRPPEIVPVGVRNRVLCQNVQLQKTAHQTVSSVSERASSPALSAGSRVVP
ncbi:hypothetical protein D9M72_626770 [compost metagenome]